MKYLTTFILSFIIIFSTQILPQNKYQLAITGGVSHIHKTIVETSSNHLFTGNLDDIGYKGSIELKYNCSGSNNLTISLEVISNSSYFDGGLGGGVFTYTNIPITGGYEFVLVLSNDFSLFFGGGISFLTIIRQADYYRDYGPPFFLKLSETGFGLGASLKCGTTYKITEVFSLLGELKARANKQFDNEDWEFPEVNLSGIDLSLGVLISI